MLTLKKNHKLKKLNLIVFGSAKALQTSPFFQKSVACLSSASKTQPFSSSYTETAGTVTSLDEDAPSPKNAALFSNLDQHEDVVFDSFIDTNASGLYAEEEAASKKEAYDYKQAFVSRPLTDEDLDDLGPGDWRHASNMSFRGSGKVDSDDDYDDGLQQGLVAWSSDSDYLKDDTVKESDIRHPPAFTFRKKNEKLRGRKDKIAFSKGATKRAWTKCYLRDASGELYFGPKTLLASKYFPSYSLKKAFSRYSKYEGILNPAQRLIALKKALRQKHELPLKAKKNNSRQPFHNTNKYVKDENKKCNNLKKIAWQRRCNALRYNRFHKRVFTRAQNFKKQRNLRFVFIKMDKRKPRWLQKSNVHISSKALNWLDANHKKTMKELLRLSVVNLDFSTTADDTLQSAWSHSFDIYPFATEDFAFAGEIITEREVRREMYKEWITLVCNAVYSTLLMTRAYEVIQEDFGLLWSTVLTRGAFKRRFSRNVPYPGDDYFKDHSLYDPFIELPSEKLYTTLGASTVDYYKEKVTGKEQSLRKRIHGVRCNLKKIKHETQPKEYVTQLKALMCIEDKPETFFTTFEEPEETPEQTYNRWTVGLEKELAHKRRQTKYEPQDQAIYENALQLQPKAKNKNILWESLFVEGVLENKNKYTCFVGKKVYLANKKQYVFYCEEYRSNRLDADPYWCYKHLHQQTVEGNHLHAVTLKDSFLRFHEANTKKEFLNEKIRNSASNNFPNFGYKNGNWSINLQNESLHHASYVAFRLCTAFLLKKVLKLARESVKFVFLFQDDGRDLLTYNPPDYDGEFTELAAPFSRDAYDIYCSLLEEEDNEFNLATDALAKADKTQDVLTNFAVLQKRMDGIEFDMFRLLEENYGELFEKTLNEVNYYTKNLFGREETLAASKRWESIRRVHSIVEKRFLRLYVASFLTKHRRRRAIARQERKERRAWERAARQNRSIAVNNRRTVRLLEKENLKTAKKTHKTIDIYAEEVRIISLNGAETNSDQLVVHKKVDGWSPARRAAHEKTRLHKLITSIPCRSFHTGRNLAPLKTVSLTNKTKNKPAADYSNAHILFVICLVSTVLVSIYLLCLYHLRFFFDSTFGPLAFFALTGILSLAVWCVPALILFKRKKSNYQLSAVKQKQKIRIKKRNLKVYKKSSNVKSRRSKFPQQSNVYLNTKPCYKLTPSASMWKNKYCELKGKKQTLSVCVEPTKTLFGIKYRSSEEKLFTWQDLFVTLGVTLTILAACYYYFKTGALEPYMEQPYPSIRVVWNFVPFVKIIEKKSTYATFWSNWVSPVTTYLKELPGRIHPRFKADTKISDLSMEEIVSKWWDVMPHERSVVYKLIDENCFENKAKLVEHLEFGISEVRLGTKFVLENYPPKSWMHPQGWTLEQFAKYCGQYQYPEAAQIDATNIALQYGDVSFLLQAYSEFDTFCLLRLEISGLASLLLLTLFILFVRSRVVYYFKHRNFQKTKNVTSAISIWFRDKNGDLITYTYSPDVFWIPMTPGVNFVSSENLVRMGPRLVQWCKKIWRETFYSVPKEKIYNISEAEYVQQFYSLNSSWKYTREGRTWILEKYCNNVNNHWESSLNEIADRFRLESDFRTEFLWTHSPFSSKNLSGWTQEEALKAWSGALKLPKNFYPSGNKVECLFYELLNKLVIFIFETVPSFASVEGASAQFFVSLIFILVCASIFSYMCRYAGNTLVGKQLKNKWKNASIFYRGIAYSLIYLLYRILCELPLFLAWCEHTANMILGFILLVTAVVAAFAAFVYFCYIITGDWDTRGPEFQFTLRNRKRKK